MKAILAIGLPLVGLLAGWLLRWMYAKFQLSSEEQRAERLKRDAVIEADLQKKDIILQAQESLQKERNQQERNFWEKKDELQKKERLLVEKEEQVEKKGQSILIRERKVEEKKEQLQKNIEQWQREVERIAELTKEEAKTLLIKSLEDEAHLDAQSSLIKIEQEMQREADKKSRSILLASMQRLASEISVENTVSSVPLPNEDMKGRIIGKEGRNIRSLESLTGVDVIIDETTEVVMLSCFDPIRREIARQSLEFLIFDGRIHPTRIEEIVTRKTSEIEQFIYETGEKALHELGIQNMQEEGIIAIGRQHFRASYGQNLLMHAIEVASLAAIIATELKADTMIVKRGAILHDVGKAIESEKDISHVELGVELAKRMKEDERVINCIEAHHGDVSYICVESVIVQIADTISAARPGARKESHENYLKRLKALEDIASEFEGVEKAYAIQAGREIRVIVDHEKVSDAEARVISRNIAKKIEESVNYPGKIRITMTRETRIIDYAR